MVDAYLASAQQPNAEYAALAFLRETLDLAFFVFSNSRSTVMLGEQAQFTSVKLGRRLGQLNPQAIRAIDDRRRCCLIWSCQR